MKHVLSSVVGVILVLVLTIGAFFLPPQQPAQADPLLPNCTVTVLGESSNLSVTCTDPVTGATIPPSQVDLGVLGEVLTVTVNVPGATVQVPGPTVTVRPAPVRITRTIRPQPVRVTATATVTRNVPGPTVTVKPKPRTITKTLTPAPVVVTETVEPDAGQEDPQSGTIEPDGNEPFFSPKIDFGDDDLTAGEAGLGILGALLLIALVMAGMGYGFYRGRKSEESGEADFLRTLLDRNSKD